LIILAFGFFIIVYYSLIIKSLKTPTLHTATVVRSEKGLIFNVLVKANRLQEERRSITFK
jgi:hypothetical protein